MLFFHCCYHIEWILVKTNHLGLSEYLINKKKKEKADACLPTLNSAAIWNVPAVDCIQKLLPSPNLILAFALLEKGLVKHRPSAPGVKPAAPGTTMMDRSDGEYRNRLALTLGMCSTLCCCVRACTRMLMCVRLLRGVCTFKEVLLKTHV